MVDKLIEIPAIDAFILIITGDRLANENLMQSIKNYE